MEDYHGSPMNHVNSIFRKKTKNNSLTNIYSEYSLKRTNFDPTNRSPNLFLNKLEKRMEVYYNSLYSSLNCKTK
jgi:hypothetical protein